MPDVVLDACCVINILAARTILPDPARTKSGRRTSRKRKVTHQLGLALYVPEVIAGESLYLNQPDDQDPAKLVKTPIDLERYFQTGLLHRCDLQSEAEAELFVKLAVQLDDGEAACLSIAASRGWTLATDDRPARKLADQLGVTVLTTPEIVRQWADVAGVSDAQVTAAVQNIERFARFTPRATGNSSHGSPPE